MPIAVTADCFHRWIAALEPFTDAEVTRILKVYSDGGEMTAASALAYLDAQAPQDDIYTVANGDSVELGGANDDDADVRRNIRAIEVLTGITAEYPLT